jgi:uncharacterized Rmd1/YagE family protein
MIKYSDLAMKILSVLTIPLIGWGVHLSMKVAVLETSVSNQAEQIAKVAPFQERIMKVETQITQLHLDMITALGQSIAIGQTSKAIAVLEERLNAIITNLKEIKRMLRNPVPVDGN